MENDPQRRAPDDEELLTIFAEVESILNTRPLTAVSSATDDCLALTPAALLHGSLHPSGPVGRAHDKDELLRGYKYTVARSRQFWDQWRAYYLPQLQKRHKDLVRTRNYMVGDLVLVMDHPTPRGVYPLARITKVFPEANPAGAIVRQVEVRFHNKDAANKDRFAVLRRPINKLALLEFHH
jgi:hypothetical protein